MSTPFLGETRIFSFNFAPKGWAQCNGQLMSINQNPALFSLLGTTYGGDGRITFGLPNLQGRVPVHVGNGHTLGERGGEVSHTLNIQELPLHDHTPQAVATAANSPTPTGNAPALMAFSAYGPASQPTVMAPQAVSNAGGSQPHSNLQPYLVLNICMALQGIFPSQT